MKAICDICAIEKASRIHLSVNYCQTCYGDYLAAVRRANSPYIVKEEAGRIKTVHFPDDEFVMAFVTKHENSLSDSECIRQAIAKKAEVENKPLQGSGEDERRKFELA